MTHPEPMSKERPPLCSADSIATQVERQAQQQPDAPALTLDGTSLSYRDLNVRANQLAHHLRQHGVRPNVLVGIYLDRSFELIIAILGILKAGGAYLPLDLACPPDRLSFLLEDAHAPFVITEKSFAAKIQNRGATLICLDETATEIATHWQENPPSFTQPQDLAYVIYTSGSTGKPKGVGVTQANVVRLFETTTELFQFGPQDVWTLFHSSAFDFSVWEIFGALLFGGRLVIVPAMVSRSATAFRALLDHENVTVLNQTPSAFRQLIQADLAYSTPATTLRYIIFGGEALEAQSLRPWLERHGYQQPQLVNMYGITETTVHVTHHLISPRDLTDRGSNIGRPLPDLQVYLVDPRGQLVAKGETGEMLIGGPGVAPGYLHRPELTRERFVENPFAPHSTSRLYRSGDLARERENGELEYLGRNDYQVKVRGFRVELPEIEAALSRYPSVRDCAVIARAEADQEPRLIAYLVLEVAGSGTVEALREHLSQTLPDYMVPAAYVCLDAFPLTLNNKLDRDALPSPGSERPHLEAPFVAPGNRLENLLARLWMKALKHDVVGADDNFFDLGGDSLLLTALHRELERDLKREVPITDLFRFPTIARLAEHLGAKTNAVAPGSQITERAQLRRAALHRGRHPETSGSLTP